MANVVDSVVFFFGQQGYLIANMDSGATTYTGFENRLGEWYIMRAVITGAATVYTYAKGSSGYAAAYVARASQTYAIPSVCFA